MKQLILLVPVVLLLIACRAQTPDNYNIKLEKITTGFTSPVGMACPDDQTNRIFVFEQGGKIKIVKNNQVSSQLFLDISNRLDGMNIAYSEKGLLGMAFHPDYKQNGKFYLYYSVPFENNSFDHKSVVSEFKVNKSSPDIAIDDPKVILEIPQPEGNHNGGMLEFGPDGYLYIGVGDGGGAGDNHGTIGNGQNTNTLLGKILRIDVNDPTNYSIPDDNPFISKQNYKKEIFALGLRNPWRFSFDKKTGELYCGDVGQNDYEEVNIIEKGGNYGWRIMEGYHCFNPAENCNTTGLILPIDEYSHDEGISICGGYIYRGILNPGLTGRYIFSDWSGKLFILEKQSDGTWKRFKPNVDNSGDNDINGKINSMGEDTKGEIYLLTQKLFGPKSPTGVLYKINNKNKFNSLSSNQNQSHAISQTTAYHKVFYKDHS